MLTELEIKSLPKPEKAKFYPDGGPVKGLFLLVQPSGRKSWAVFYRVAGKQRKVTLGAWPDVGIAKARQLAAKTREKVASGADPQAEKVAARKASELNERLLFETVLAEFLKRHVQANKLRSASEVERVFEKNVTPFWGKKSKGGEKLVTDIKKLDVIAIIDRVADRGRLVQANRVLAQVRRFYNWCVERGYIEVPPTLGVKGAVRESTLARDRVLSEAEVRAAWKAAEAEGYPFGVAIKLLLLTGQRRQEVLDAKWSEIDLDKALWSLPASRTKNGTAHTVPLSQAVLEILASVPRFDGSELVFPANTVAGRRAGNSISGISKVKSRLDQAVAELIAKEAKDAGVEPPSLEPWRIHDLRRTCATGLQRLGFGREIRDAVTNHKSGGGIDAIYSRYAFTEEKARALAAWAAEVARIVENRSADSNIVPLPQAERRA